MCLGRIYKNIEIMNASVNKIFTFDIRDIDYSVKRFLFLLGIEFVSYVTFFVCVCLTVKKYCL